VGQKVNPIGFRLGVIKTWDSRWYAAREKYVQNFQEDILLRDYLSKKLKNSAVSKIDIERAANKVKLIINTARPGIVIGKKGAGIDQLRAELQKLTTNDVHLAISEIRKPDMDALLVAANIALQLEKRVSWRRAIKKSILAATKSGVRGIKIRISGRLDGAEIARSEWYNEKSVPLHTLRADIDYGTAESLTAYGILGVKVWIYKGDILSIKEAQEVGRAKS